METEQQAEVILRTEATDIIADKPIKKTEANADTSMTKTKYVYCFVSFRLGHNSLYIFYFRKRFVWSNEEMESLVNARLSMEEIYNNTHLRADLSLLWDECIANASQSTPSIIRHGRFNIIKKYQSMKTIYFRTRQRTEIDKNYTIQWKFFKHFDDIYAATRAKTFTAPSSMNVNMKLTKLLRKQRATNVMIKREFVKLASSLKRERRLYLRKFLAEQQEMQTIKN